MKPLQKSPINKKLGQTPLQALESFRADMIKFWQNVPMTYAGRLDPLAGGMLLILIGDECKNKEKYNKLDKEYEVEIVFGISTDTYDSLGLATLDNNSDENNSFVKLDLAKYQEKFTQKYPPYSSKTVGGIALHTLSRNGDLPDPDEMPEKEVEIYSIENIGNTETNKINAKKLLDKVTSMIDLVQGDFRQDEIKKRWNDILNESRKEFSMIKIRVKCSSGTYMRSLADRIGKDMGTGAFAISINRTQIFGL